MKMIGNVSDWLSYAGGALIKVADSAGSTVTAKLISAFVLATRIVQFLFYLNPKFQASSSFLCLYRPVCVGPVGKPHCWFSHEAAHFLAIKTMLQVLNEQLQVTAAKKFQNSNPGVQQSFKVP